MNKYIVLSLRLIVFGWVLFVTTGAYATFEFLLGDTAGHMCGYP